MDAILIKPSTKEESKLLQQLLNKMNITAEVLSQDDLEDCGLLNAMNQERTGNFVSEDDVMKALS